MISLFAHIAIRVVPAAYYFQYAPYRTPSYSLGLLLSGTRRGRIQQCDRHVWPWYGARQSSYSLKCPAQRRGKWHNGDTVDSVLPPSRFSFRGRPFHVASQPDDYTAFKEGDTTDVRLYPGSEGCVLTAGVNCTQPIVHPA